MEPPRSSMENVATGLRKSRVPNPLRWSLVDRALALAIATLVFRVFNEGFVRGIASDPAARTYADFAGVAAFEQRLLGIIAGWLVLGAVGIAIRRRYPMSKPYVHVCTFYFWVTDAVMGYGLGTLAPAYWVVLLGASVLMLIAFGGRYTYPGLLTAAAAIFGEALLERMNVIRYAPIFVRAPYLPDGRPLGLWWFAMTGTSVSIAVFIILGAHYLIKRWKEYDALLEQLSQTDHLTGLANRRFFRERCVSELARARRNGHTVGLLMIDVDHFKDVNDRWGHQAGDDVLRAIAATLLESVRTEDVVSRYGGEEFAVLLVETDLEGTLGVAERFRQRLDEREIETSAGKLHVTATVGTVATTITDLTHIDDLLRAADKALYRGKQSGRNRVEQGQYDPPHAVREERTEHS